MLENELMSKIKENAKGCRHKMCELEMHDNTRIIESIIVKNMPIWPDARKKNASEIRKQRL